MIHAFCHLQQADIRNLQLVLWAMSCFIMGQMERCTLVKCGRISPSITNASLCCRNSSLFPQTASRILLSGAFWERLSCALLKTSSIQSSGTTTIAALFVPSCRAIVDQKAWLHFRECSLSFLTCLLLFYVFPQKYSCPIKNDIRKR